MSDPDKRKPSANATIQIDLDQVQLFDPDAAPGGADAKPGAHKIPPPLPATPPVPSAAAPAPRSLGKTIAYVAMFVALLAVAIVGGLMVGTRARRHDSPVALGVRRVIEPCGFPEWVHADAHDADDRDALTVSVSSRTDRLRRRCRGWTSCGVLRRGPTLHRARPPLSAPFLRRRRSSTGSPCG